MMQRKGGGRGGTLPYTGKRQPKFRLRELAFCFTRAALLFLISSFAVAQAPRGTLVHEGTLHIAPDAQSAKLSEVARGHELVILETSRDWAHVQAIISEPRKDRDEDDEESQGKTISGWVSGKALVSNATSNGDKIIFGEAADSEDQASRRRGRPDAAQNPTLLYYRLSDLFPPPPLAAA